MECLVVAGPYLVNIQKALGRSYYYYTACDAFWWNNTAFLWSTSHGWWFHCYGVVDLWRQLSPLTHWVTKLRQSVCEHNPAKILLNSNLNFENMAISWEPLPKSFLLLKKKLFGRIIGCFNFSLAWSLSLCFMAAWLNLYPGVSVVWEFKTSLLMLITTILMHVY